MRFASRAVVVVVVLVGCLGAGVSGAWAAQVNLCVPTTAGQPITSNGSGTSCSGGNTPVALPSSSADQQALISLLPHLSFVSAGVGGKPTVKFTGVNVQVVSGSGSTSGTVNGEGNLVIGYDETPGSQTGSHNLVLGTNQSYRSYGSIIAGTNNTDTGHSSAVLGYQNNVSGIYSTITGGQSGTVSGTYAGIQGGYSNTVTGSRGSIAGGCDNLAGTGTVSLPPSFCATSGDFAQIGGGEGNEAVATSSTVSGGQFNLASDPFSSVTAGCSNATGTGSAPEFECAFTGGESVTGGIQNHASGEGDSVSGGISNRATGYYNSVSGGDLNSAVGFYSSIAAGEFNVASDNGSFVGGGCDNLAGPGTPYTDECNVGEEAVLGGNGQQVTADDGTYPAGP